MANVGLKISKPGVDVKTAEDNDLIFTSKYPALKMIDHGYGSKTFTEDGGSITLKNHNLGYKPFFVVWLYTDDGSFILPIYYYENTYWRVHFYASTNENRLILANTNIWQSMPPPPSLADQEVDYAWALFYDPIREEAV